MFKVTKNWLTENYANINRAVYEGILPPVKFKVKKDLKLRMKIKGKVKFKKLPIWAYAQGFKIVTNNEFQSEKMARDILAHEMVHIWQNTVTSVDVHGKSFKTWKRHYRKHQLKLSKTCNEKDYI